MAWIKCVCGHRLSNTVVPNEIQGVLLTNQDMQFNDKKNCVEIAELGRDVWECPKCGRLCVNWPMRDDVTVKWYRPEDAQPGKIMSFKK